MFVCSRLKCDHRLILQPQTDSQNPEMKLPEIFLNIRINIISNRFTFTLSTLTQTILVGKEYISFEKKKVCVPEKKMFDGKNKEENFIY